MRRGEVTGTKAESGRDKESIAQDTATEGTRGRQCADCACYRDEKA